MRNYTKEISQFKTNAIQRLDKGIELYKLVNIVNLATYLQFKFTGSNFNL